MRLSLFIITLPLLCGQVDAKAQVPEELSSMPEQWQLTLDVIKSKAQTLLVENNGLQAEYRQLVGQAQKLQGSINGQQISNEKLQRSLEERHGRTDQQLRIEELTQGIKIKTQQARDIEQQWQDLKRKQLLLDRKAALPPVIEGNARSRTEDQLPQLRKQLEAESTQEVLLENELNALRSGHLSPANTAVYDDLKTKKQQLESDIYAYELRLDDLRRSYLAGTSWPSRKKALSMKWCGWMPVTIR
jgi:hypothetical protein